MIENAVKHDFYAVFMQSIAHISEILISSESAVDDFVVDSVVTVLYRFKNRSEVNDIEVHLFKMRNPIDDLANSRYRSFGRFGAGLFTAAESERINMVNVAFFYPM